MARGSNAGKYHASSSRNTHRQAQAANLLASSSDEWRSTRDDITFHYVRANINSALSKIKSINVSIHV